MFTVQYLQMEIPEVENAVSHKKPRISNSAQVTGEGPYMP
jgi:hypothetical protein